MLTATTSNCGEPSLPCKRVERRHFLAAGNAPGRPQIDQHGAAAASRRAILRLPVGVLEREHRQLAGILGGPDRRHLAMGQRLDPAGEVVGGAAGRVARIARDADNTVYRRQRTEPGQHGGRDQRALAPLQPHAAGSVSIVMFDNHGPVMSNKMWGGRFSAEPDAIMADINASIDVDCKLFRQDIAASRAHAEMLGHQGIISAQDAQSIVDGLDTILSEIEGGQFEFKRALEDIHMNVEARLAELIGPAAGRLHTARSRNDQVATDFRLWVRDAIDGLDASLADYQRALAEQALAHAATVMPGFTHLQTAQPVTFGHHLLAYVEMAARDRGRFADARRRGNECPLGAAALAGTSFPLDRAMTAKALGFDRPAANSLDAVSDRDFVLETLCAAAIASVHLSRFAEEIVIWTSPLVGFLKLSDKFTTGSSIMPQKRNPDAAELVRAKTGRIIGVARRAADRDEGAAARLPEGHAGGQGRRDGRARRLVALPRRDDRHGARHDRRSRPHARGGRPGLRDRDRPCGLAGART